MDVEHVGHIGFDRAQEFQELAAAMPGLSGFLCLRRLVELAVG
jgi:hypothetical protein